MAKLLSVAVFASLMLLSSFLMEVRGLAGLQGGLEKLKVNEGFIDRLLPFTDTACFIEEYAGLVGAMYDTEQFDREKAKTIIADYLGPVGLQAGVAKMLYLSMRELVPILALESVPSAVFDAFDERIARRCNGNRRLREVVEDAEPVEVDDAEPVDVDDAESAWDGEPLDNGGEVESVEELDEESVNLEGIEEVEAGDEELNDDVEGLMRQEALEDLKELEGVEVFPVAGEVAMDGEEIGEAVEIDDGTSVSSEEASYKKEEAVMFDGISEALAPENLQAVFDSLLTNGNDAVTSFIESSVGSDFDFRSKTSPFRGAAAAAAVTGDVVRADRKSSCAVLAGIDNHCFVVKYAGFVGASWGTQSFDEQKAKFILDSFVPVPKLVGTVATAMCLAADSIMPLFAGDTSITEAAIDGFFASVPSLCPK
eukprot:GHVS01071650.1.p1 GENE.GHVS01071650.1~~GHVS01071650.1.p1  ORF type:complete len:425 (+),score=82.86 GHVS01071650.1:461-1735(+)